MAPQNIPPQEFDLVESFLGGNVNDGRVLLQNLLQQVSKLNQATGQSATNPDNVPVPPQGTLAVDGSNGAFNIAITPGETDNPGTQYHEVSYSPTKGFTNGVVTLPPTTATSMVVNAPGKNMFFRVRSSYNNVRFNQPKAHGQSAVDSGYISSDAISDGATFNQSNLGTVTSSQEGGTASIHIQGAGGTLTSMVRLKGSKQTILPAATIVGNALGSSNFVGYDGHDYVVKSTLGAVLDDKLTPIGKVTVVSEGNPGEDGGGTAQAGNGARMSNV